MGKSIKLMCMLYENGEIYMLCTERKREYGRKEEKAKYFKQEDALLSIHIYMHVTKLAGCKLNLNLRMLSCCKTVTVGVGEH